MRRNEFSMEQQTEVEQFLAEMTFGFLGTTSEDGWPHITPLNYVYFKGNLYFHGSKIGQKMEDLKQAADRVSFAVAQEFALIPSYFSDPNLACPATAYFKSVYMKGFATVLEDVEEKAEALTVFMQKLQPEGGYNPITPSDPAYLPQIKGVAVVKITVQEMTAKFKFGQNVKEPRLSSIIDELEKRQKSLDPETAEAMRKFCPHLKSF
jgi:nitroimidazol reductase NimA-like FMN-containing flavoprotein (pyridoxamine 5'-phosphate oxidase superfamily)